VAPFYYNVDSWKQMEKTMTDYFYSHQQFLVDIANLKSQIIEAGFKPEYIFAFVRGGAIPAIALSHAFGGIPVKFVKFSSTKTPKYNRKLGRLMEEHNVLVVEDIIDSGKTVKAFYELYDILIDDEIDAAKAAGSVIGEGQVRFATLVNNVSNGVDVDYVGTEIDRNTDQRWVKFWWESL
jgi:hypoxanthine phosphoribosyltransferase